MAVSVLCLFMAVSWIGMHCVIVALLSQIHSHFDSNFLVAVSNMHS